MKIPSSVVICSVLVVVFASYVVQHPHVVLFVPKIGHWLWLQLGGQMAPFVDRVESNLYMKCIDRTKCPWLTSGDVIVDVCGKCGTNWMLSIVHELRTWDKPELQDFEDVLDVSPWPEFRRHPADLPDERYLTWGQQWNRSEYKLKEFKSHFPPYVLNEKKEKVTVMPVKERRDLKFIVMVRNPADMLSSFVKFIDVHRQEFLDSFGGVQMWSSDIEQMVSILGTDFYEHTPFNFYLKWKEYKDEPNVLFLHYSDLVHDLTRNLRKVAEFLDIEISESGLEGVEKRTDFKFMKEHSDRYQYLAGKNRDIPVLTSDGLVRKGGVKLSNRELTPEIQKRIHDFGLTKMSADDLEKLEHGFN